MDPKHDAEIRARRALRPPFSYKAGYILDADGRLALDEYGSRVQGWGWVGALQDGSEIQDAIGARVAAILSKHWNDA